MREFAIEMRASVKALARAAHMHALLVAWAGGSPKTFPKTPEALFAADAPLSIEDAMAELKSIVAHNSPPQGA